MDYLSNLLGKKKGSSPSRKGGSSKVSSHNNTGEEASPPPPPPAAASFSENADTNNTTNIQMMMSGQDNITPMNSNSAGAATNNEAGYNNLSGASASPGTQTKKLIAMMTDSSTKTVRVSVNNEEVVITARELNQFHENVEEGDGEQGLMAMMGDDGGVGIERSTSGSTNTSSNDLLGFKNNGGMESNYNGNGDNTNTAEGHSPPPPVASLSRQTSTSSTNNDAAAALSNGDNNASASSTTNNTTNAVPATTNNEQRTDSAALLLGIAENLIGIPGVDEDGNPKREPGGDLSTLPSSMTSFLDMLTEDQRRKRHRYIPAVEGFRRLYKNEIKGDMAVARVLNRKRREFDPNAVMEDVGDENNDAMMMMEEKEEEEEEDNGALVDEVGGGEEGSGDKKDKDAFPDKMSFIVPSEDAMSLANSGKLASLMVNTPFENSFKGQGGGGGAPSTSGSSVPRSPQLVDSLTAFNPPRPQESTAAKTKHRLKRWEANPAEVETDLSNYRKTVQRTRKELQAAENERGRIELVSAVMREHFQKHLTAYKEEIMAVNDQLLETNMGCLKAEERYNVARSMSLRGSGKSMKDVLTTLTVLEDELKNASAGGGAVGSSGSAVLSSEKSLDWRVPGVGGISTPGSKAEMASGWILEGDNVIIPSGEEGEVIEVKVVQALDDVADKKDDATDKKEGEDAMDVDKPKEEEKKGSAEKPANPMDGTKSADAFALAEKISVRLSNGDVKVFTSSELKFNPKKLPTLTHVNRALGKRWREMLKTAEAGKHSHDLSAMDNYINASFATDDSEDGNDTPATNNDDCLVVPFGSDMIAAPESVRAFPSVIPPDILEETVRKVIYETTTPRIIPDIPEDLKKYESQKEDLNRYQARVMQLRHRLGRQKRLRRFNERSLAEGKSRSHKVENLLLEMQMDLKNLKERLHGELSELGISNTVFWNGENGADEANGAAVLTTDTDPSAAEVGLINNVETALEPESKRVRVE